MCHCVEVPDRTLRIVTFVHRCGDGVEVTQDAEGFGDLIVETCRRFCPGSEVRTAVASLFPGSVLNIDVARRVDLLRTVTATISPKHDHGQVSFGVRGQSRQFLLRALQDEPDFLQLVHRFAVRVVPCIDGQFYSLAANKTDDFVAEVGRLVEAYIPEIPD